MRPSSPEAPLHPARTARSHPAQHPDPAAPADGYFVSGFYPQTPTLSSPDTPTTAGLGSSAPPTPSTPAYGPPAPAAAHARGTKARAPDSPRPAFEQARRDGGWDAPPGAEDEGQELVIPSSCAAFRAPRQVALAPPPAVSHSLGRLKGAGDDAHRRQGPCDADAGLHTQGGGAYTCGMSSSATIWDESLDLGMFEMVTPTQDGGFESAPGEKPRAVPADTPPHAASPSTDGSCAAAVPRTPSAPSLFLRRHRPPPISVLQDLNALAGRFRGFRRSAQPPAVESRSSASLNAPAEPSGWFPPPGPGSPPRFFSDSPAPLTLSSGEAHESGTSGELRRHRPRSVRSISLMDLGESLLTQPSHGSEGGSAEAGDAGARACVNEQVLRGHRRQLALSFSLQTFGDFERGAGTRASPPQQESECGPEETLVLGCEGWPPWELRAEPKMAASEAQLDPGRGKKRENGLKAKAGGFWKKLGSSVSGLFERHGKVEMGASTCASLISKFSWIGAETRGGSLGNAEERRRVAGPIFRARWFDHAAAPVARRVAVDGGGVDAR